MKTSRTRNLLKSIAVKAHDMLFAHMVRSGAVLCVADASAVGAESLLTSGQETTAATGDQTAAATTTVDAGTQTADTTKTEGSTEGVAGDKGTSEAKTEEGTKEGDKPAGAPETYEAFKMPEGYALDEAMLGEFTPVLKELNLSQEAAQKVMDFAPKLIERTVAETQSAVLENLGLKDHATWAAAVKADKEIGGDKLPENLGIAKKAFTTYFSPETQTLINRLGLGTHPGLIRGLVAIGKTISEDGFVPGGKTTTSATPATRLFDKSNMNP